MKKILSLALILLLLLSISACDTITPKRYEKLTDPASLRVHFINVEQGDSILLESEGEFVLVDAGEKDYGLLVLDYFKDQNGDKLKYVIATHPHTDHIGGLTHIINGIETENFIAYETDQRTSTWLNVLKAVEKNNVNYIDAKVGAEYRFGKASFTILAPRSDNYEGGYNNYSIVIMVQCGDTRFLLTGDAERESEREMLDAGVDLRADVLKCGHHGSSDATSEGFLMAVDPAYAIISCMKDNEYGHPHQETLHKLKLMDCTYLRTDQLGSIVAETDGTQIRFTYDNKFYEPITYTVGDHKDHSDIATYVGNKNSRYFHYRICSGAESMKEKNRVEFTTREEAVKAGYSPCPSCQP